MGVQSEVSKGKSNLVGRMRKN